MEINRRERKKIKTHNDIMHSAKVLLEKKGIGNVTAEEISESADISRSTFFTHFKSIEELLSSIANQEIKDLMEYAENTKEKGVNKIYKFMDRLIDDTFLYPYLMLELMVKGMLGAVNKEFKDTVEMLHNELEYDNVKSDKYTAEEIISIIVGGYLGLIGKKVILKENFEDKTKTKESMNKLIKNITSGGSI